MKGRLVGTQGPLRHGFKTLQGNLGHQGQDFWQRRLFQQEPQVGSTQGAVHPLLGRLHLEVFLSRRIGPSV